MVTPPLLCVHACVCLCGFSVADNQWQRSSGIVDTIKSFDTLEFVLSVKPKLSIWLLCNKQV